MTILKKIIIASCILITAPLSQAGCWLDLDYEAYYAHVKIAENTLDAITQKQSLRILHKHNGDKDIMRMPHQKFVDGVYILQKNALKDIIQTLSSQAINSDNKSDILLHDLFKNKIYKQWKETFKNNYANSLKNNDWTWILQPTFFYIEE